MRIRSHRNIFILSSRRRHTRFDCDWSSDVCSSDLSCSPGHGGRRQTMGYWFSVWRLPYCFGLDYRRSNSLIKQSVGFSAAAAMHRRFFYFLCLRMKAGMESHSDSSWPFAPFSGFLTPFIFWPPPTMGVEEEAVLGVKELFGKPAGPAEGPNKVAVLPIWSSGNPEAITVILTSPFLRRSS